MANDQDLRPSYYEDQYLGADDLDQAVLYGRIQQARHALGAHTWGISIGLDLVEKPRPGGGNRVDVFITPGYAWDGYGRPIVVLAPAQLLEPWFADIRFDPQNASHVNGKGELVPVWLQYAQQGLRPPQRGFETCREGDHNSRIQETYRILVGSFTGADLHSSVAINSTAIAPQDAIHRFENIATASGTTPGRTLFDESVPHQEFPIDDPRARWLIPIGSVRWLPINGGTGQFVTRDNTGNPPDADIIREQRRYAGVVTERIEGAGGVLRLRNRFADPNTVSFHAPRIAGENEVVWVEGDLRVVGDARLAGGTLAFRIPNGTDENTPLEIRRMSGGGTLGNRRLQVVIGPETQDTNRFSVGRIKTATPGQPIEQRFVVTSGGNIGIDTDTPTQKLTIRSSFDTLLEITPTSASLPWQSDGTVNDGAFVINQQSANSQRPDADFALMRDRKKRLALGDTDTFISSQNRGGTQGQLRFFLNHGEPGEKEVLRINQFGNVGIGVTSPVATLQLDGDLAIQARQQGPAKVLPQNATLIWNDGTWLRLNQNLDFSKPIFGVHVPGVFAPGSLNVGGAASWGDPGFGNVWVTGRVGIGSTTPGEQLTIASSRPYIEFARTGGGNAYLGMSDGSPGLDFLFGFPRLANHPQSNLHRFWLVQRGSNGEHTGLVLDDETGVHVFGPGDAGWLFAVSDEDNYNNNGTAFNPKFVVRNDGKVGVGLSVPAYTLHVNGNAAKPGGGSWTNSSDQRLKKNIARLSGALDKLTRLRGVVYEWRDPRKHGDLTGQQIGLVAQDVEKVFPEWVGTDGEGYKDLTVRGFEALTVEAFKEVVKEIEILKRGLTKQEEPAGLKKSKTRQRSES